jgi:hypothetical protein
LPNPSKFKLSREGWRDRFRHSDISAATDERTADAEPSALRAVVVGSEDRAQLLPARRRRAPRISFSHPLLLDVLRPWLRSDFCMALCDLAAAAFAIASSFARAADPHTPGAAARSEAALSPGYAVAAPVC